ncbi:MAG: hypothetical protein H0V70_09005 [Ktedonobacteraceae bacterium]|nr:hypothetical protein [Ktedonobacteraceae bacterium]
MANQSEVANLLAQITAEYNAAHLGLEGYAMTARHDIITARMEHLETAREALVEELGADVAMSMIIEAIDKGNQPS